MYESFFGLRSNPFSMTADPTMLYITPQHREALAALTYGIAACKGVMALTGDAGTGKTSVLMRLVTHLQNGTLQSSMILNPVVSAGELLEMIATGFGISDVCTGKAKLLQQLHEFLLQTFRSGHISLLIVDEAHRLSADLLEELRLLSNFEIPQQKLLQIVLSGQPELTSVLNETSMRQVKQRISLRARLLPLAGTEVPAYIDFRWSRVAETKAPFSLESLSAVAELSSGIPRLINSLCDNALITAFAEKSRLVTPAHVAQAASDLDLTCAAAEAIERRTPCQDGTEEVATESSTFEKQQNHDQRALSFLTRFRSRTETVLADTHK
jgi:general secretion pathway protein A